MLQWFSTISHAMCAVFTISGCDYWTPFINSAVPIPGEIDSESIPSIRSTL